MARHEDNANRLSTIQSIDFTGDEGNVFAVHSYYEVDCIYLFIY